MGAVSSAQTPTAEPATTEQADGGAPEVRPVLAQAVEVARASVLDGLEPGAAERVGEHLAVVAEEGGAATHRFAAALPGYRGWEWAVVVAATPDATEVDEVTVSEVVLLPGADALVSPAWVPWSERVRAGDLGAGDLLPPPADDPRLAPAYLASDDPAVEEVALELGLGRVHVMSREGRLDTAERWEAGDTGPGSDWAKATDLTCGTCGFYLPVAGSLGAAFGVCGNEMAADGRVVHAEHGCGAHSEVVVEVPPVAPVTELTYDDTQLDVEALPRRDPAPAAGAPAGPERAADEGSPGDPVESGEEAPGDTDGEETGPGTVPGEPLPAGRPEPDTDTPDPSPGEIPAESHPAAPDDDAPVDPGKSVEQDEPARQE